jgi:hypothetical protein
VRSAAYPRHDHGQPARYRQVILNVGRTAGRCCFVLRAAHSRVLSMTGFTDAAKMFLLGTGLGPWGS